jgi:hypothetical protein
MRKLGILDKLDKIQKRLAIGKKVWERTLELDGVLREVEAVKLAAAQVSRLSERAVGALMDNGDDGLAVADWLARAREISAIAERAETALSAKRRKAEKPQFQQWLVGEQLTALYMKAFGVKKFPAARRGPSVEFVNECLQYIEFVDIERELLVLEQASTAPVRLCSDPSPLDGETIKFWAYRAGQEAKKNQTNQGG